MSDLREEINRAEIVEAFICVRGASLNFNFTRVVLSVKTNIKTKEVLYCVKKGNSETTYDNLDEATNYFLEIVEKNKTKQSE